MSYHLEFNFDKLTEDEKWELLKKLDLIKHHIYSDLEIECTGLHRENRVWIDQDIPNESVAFELFKLLKSISIHKEYDDYYETGADSHCVCSLSYSKDYPLSEKG